MTNEIKGLELVVVVPAEKVQELFAKGLAAVLTDCSIRLPQTVSDEVQAEEMTEPVMVGGLPLRFVEKEKQEARERSFKKLIKFICPDCGTTNYAVVDRENGVYKMNCISCGEDYSFEDDGLTKAEYVCPDCGRNCVYYTPDKSGMVVTKNKCKCGCYTALSYSQERKRYVLVAGW